MCKGVVFDIKEFAVHDGPGIRITVFMKGCPLRCTWCHNPEGMSPEPQLLRGAAGERMAGQWFTSAELAARINDLADLLRQAEGGVTFSGGEPLAQVEFLIEVLDLLQPLHILLDTSGLGPERDFRRLASRSHLVYFDLKLIDRDAHAYYTGMGNELILRNLQVLSQMALPFVIRVPLIPGVTDTQANLSGIAQHIAGLPGLERVDLLPYNHAASAKYGACGLNFYPKFNAAKPVSVDTTCFHLAGVETRIL
ncbi:MAG TPA: radical SAM protein [Candidatus Acidoferrales bacterium]|nr:radical SAM protein [Candidatus Acidoferrales bacterium]